jgi:hypothetical protein
MNLRSGRRRNPFGVGIGWLTAWRDSSLCCLMTATVAGSSSIAAAVAAIECKPKVATTRMDSRQTATGALAIYCSHAAERILAACSMLP